MVNDDRPIVKIIKKGGHSGHHGGAWKVAYADFVTAMMAFFLVMWILGLNQDVRKAIAAYFNDPIGLAKSHAGASKNEITLNTNSVARPKVLSANRSIRRGEDVERMKKMKRQLENLMSTVPEFKAIQKFVDITITQDGLRIELVEDPRSPFFESGSATLKPSTVKLLEMIGTEIAKLPNGVVLEGHTDAAPYSSGDSGYSNWELSADRANAARKVMTPTLRPNQVSEVRALADRHLRNPANPLHFSNRRITILVTYLESEANPTTKELGPQTVLRPGSVDLTAAQPR